MLRRLLIAAFAFSFVVALGSAAFADVTPDLEKQARPVPGNTANQNKVIVPTWLQQPANFQRSADDAQGPVYTGLYGSPAAASPDTSACYDQDWTDYAGTSFFFTWTRPGGDTRELAMRMDIPAGHTAEVYGSYVYLFEVQAGAEVTVTMYGDAGGIPDDGDVIHTETIGPLAEDTLGGYYYVTYTGGPIVLTDRAKFHVSVLSTAAGGELVRFGSDDGGDPTNGGTAEGTERSSYRSAGVWYNAKALFADGFDPNFIITADMCQYFSDCYTLNGLESSPGAGTVGLWFVPDDDPGWPDGGSLTGMGQRFSVANDTLVQIRARFWTPATFFGPLAYYDSSSTNGLEVNVWMDDGTGNIDEGAGPIATRTVAGGLATLYPGTGNLVGGTESHYFDMLPDNIIVKGPVHITMEMTSSAFADGVVLMALNSTSSNAPAEGASVLFTGGSAPGWQRTGQNNNWLSYGGGQEQAHLIYPTFCRDEFQDCQNQILWGVQPYWVWTMFDGSNNNQFAHLVKGNPVNKVEKIRVQIADETIFGGLSTDNGDPDMQINVYEDLGTGVPGSIIYSQVVTDPVYFPGWTEVVIPGGLQVLGSFFVGYEGIWPDPVNDYFYAFTDDDAQAPINGGALIYRLDFGPAWVDLDVDLGYVDNLVAEVEFCSVPVDEYTCIPGTDWAVMQHDFSRVGHSGNAMGDAYCDLSLVWSYEHPTQLSAFAGPIIKDGKLVQAFGNEYKVFNLADGTEVLTLGPFGTGIFCIPAIATIDIGGTPTDVLFLASGSTGQVHAYDWADAAAGISTPLWTFTAPGSGRAIQWGNFIVLNDGTDDVLFTAENGGRLHAIDAETGLAYAPWGGSFNFVGFGPTTSRNGATDGVGLIYYGTNSAGFLGDLFAFNAFTKTIAWQLSATAGLQGQTIFGTATSDEGFDGGIMYEAPFGSEPGKLYVNSSMTGNNPVDGVFYILEASAGSLIATKASNRMRYSTPMLDAQNVYVASFTRWVNPPAGGDLIAFAKSDASVSWAYSANVAGGYSRYYNEGFVTCEPDAAPDLIFVMNESGFLSCVNAQDGDEIFTRRIDYLQGNPGTSTANIGGAGAIVPDTMAFSHYYGGVSVLAKSGVDRPRLEVLSWRASQAIPFGTNPDTTVVFPAMYTNTGCADLNLTLVADENQNGTTPGKVASVGKDKADMAAYLADQMATNGFVNAKFTQTMDAEASQMDDPRITSRRDVNRAAMAAPPYLVVSSYPGIVVAPGDTADIEVRVDMNLLSRGQYNFYMELQNDDPDYYMNTATAGGLYPDVRLTMVSGCVIDTTTLHFGAGGANHQLVTNTGRLGTGDWHPSSDGPGNFDIDGDNSSYYQGGLGYGVSMRRIAMNTQDWTTYAPGSAKDDEEGAYVSLQGDPNYVNGDCKPAINTSVAVPDVSSDGITYTPLSASAVYSSFLDSVQVFETGGVWDWDLVADLNYDSPFDNDSTMGIYVNSRTIGVTDAPAIVSALNQATVQVMEFTERNGNTVSDWAMWHFVDYDVGTDSVAGNIANSVVWTWDVGGGTQVWGTVKIPFGPGYDPIVNNIGIVGNTTGNEQGFWAYDTYWDSCYMYAADYPTGVLVRTIQPMTTQGDGEAHHSFVRDVTFDPNGTYTFGIAHFSTDLAAPGNYGSPEAINLAQTVNKFAGFGRGDMNNDDALNIADVVILANYLFHGGPGAIPFAHLADVNADGTMNLTDVNYMVDYYFNYGPPPVGDWEI